MLTFEKRVRDLATIVAVAGLLLLLVVAFFTLLDGLLRAFANRPLDFVRETGDLVAAVAGACCLPIVIMERGNITLQALEGIFPLRMVRLIDLVNSVVILGLLVAMGWQFFLFSMKTMRAGENTWLLNIPKAPFWFVVDAILWICVLVQVVLVAQAWSQFREMRTDP